MKKLIPILFVSLLFFSCKEPDPPAPVEVTCTSYVDGVLFSWPEDENVVEYKVEYGEETYTVKENEFFIRRNAFWESEYLITVSITPCEKNKEGEPVEVNYKQAPAKDSFSYEYSYPDYKTVEFTFSLKNLYEADYSFEIKKDKWSQDKGEKNQNTVTVDSFQGYSCKCDDYRILVYLFTEDENGEVVEKIIGREMIDFSNKPFPAVKDVKVESISRRKAKLAYTRFDTSDIPDIDINYLRYIGSIFDSEGNLIEEKLNGGYGIEYFEFEKLEPSTQYSFSVRAIWKDTEESSVSETGEPVTATTKKSIEISAPTIIETANTLLTHPYTNISVSFTQSPDDTEGKYLYYINTYVTRHNRDTFTYYSVPPNDSKVFSETNGVVEKEGVNGGNEIKAVVIVIDPDDGNYGEYSNPGKLQLKEVTKNISYGLIKDEELVTIDENGISYGESASGKYYINLVDEPGLHGTIRVKLKSSTPICILLYDSFYTKKVTDLWDVYLATIDKAWCISPGSGAENCFSLEKVIKGVTPKGDCVPDKAIFNNSVYVYVQMAEAYSNKNYKYVGYSVN